MEHLFSIIEHMIAPFVIHVLELIGIFLITTGSLRAFWRLICSGFNFSDRSTQIMLGESLAMALEFKLGAEIIKSVIIRDLSELIILGFVVVLRIVLTFVVHWDLKQMEENNYHDTIVEEQQNAAAFKEKI